MRFCSQKWSSSRAAKMSWWRSVVDKTTRLQYDTACKLAIHNINILVVIWRFKESTQFRITRHVLPQKHILLINSVHNTMSQDKIEHRIKLTIFWQKLNSFQHQKHDLILVRRTLTFTIDLFRYWTVKLCKEEIHFICTLNASFHDPGDRVFTQILSLVIIDL